MRINTNVAALNSYNQLNNTNNNLSKSLERLSSGKRINSASDDAAGLAISEKMNSQTKGLAKAQRNAQDGISMIQTAEGALKESHSILQRMRELSVQSANDTNTDDDRAEIQKEIEQLTSELDRISSDTEFNTQKLLNGEKEFTSEVSTDNSNLGEVEVTNQDLESGEYTLNVENASASNTSWDATNLDSLSGSDITIDDAEAGEYQIEVSNHSNADDTADITFKDADGVELGTVEGEDLTAADIAIAGFTMTGDISGEITGDGSATFETQVKADMTVTNEDGDEVGSVTGETANSDGEITIEDFGSVEVDGSLSNDADNKINLTNNAATLHIGANEDQNTKADMNDMSSEALEVDDVDLSTQEGANEAISTIDDAIGKVSAERSKLGAVQNRLDHTINNLNTSEENLTAAESRISDVDMAKEMMNMSKQQILSQAGNAMMAQANQLPQGVLQLLG